MNPRTIDLSPLRKALAMLMQAIEFWNGQPDGAPLKPHLRSAVIQSFEFTYELSVRLTRLTVAEAGTVRLILERVIAGARCASSAHVRPAGRGRSPTSICWLFSRRG